MPSAAKTASVNASTSRAGAFISVSCSAAGRQKPSATHSSSSSHGTSDSNVFLPATTSWFHQETSVD